MRPKERRDSGQSDLFRARLDQIIDLGHPLAKLAATIDWRFLEERFGAVYSDKPGQPPLPTRLMAGLSILKHTHNLSDEELCARWIENPYFQLFCGEEFFRHKPPFDRSSLTRWRQRMGEEKLVALIQESLNAATRAGAAKPSDFSPRSLWTRPCSRRRWRFRPTPSSCTGRASFWFGWPRGTACGCANPMRAWASGR